MSGTSSFQFGWVNNDRNALGFENVRERKFLSKNEKCLLLLDSPALELLFAEFEACELAGARFPLLFLTLYKAIWNSNWKSNKSSRRVNEKNLNTMHLKTFSSFSLRSCVHFLLHFSVPAHHIMHATFELKKFSVIFEIVHVFLSICSLTNKFQ